MSRRLRALGAALARRHGALTVAQVRKLARAAVLR